MVAAAEPRRWANFRFVYYNEVMIGLRCREKKRAVRDVWKRYTARRGTAEDGVDPVFLAHRAQAPEEAHRSPSNR